MRTCSSSLPAAVLAATALVIAGCGPAKNKFEKEADNELLAVTLAEETIRGQYDLITAGDLKLLMLDGTEMLIVDTAPVEKSYQKAHLPGAKPFLLPQRLMEDEWDAKQTGGKTLEDFERFLGDDKDRVIVVYCGYTKCARSHNGALWVRRLGYTNVKRFPGGLYAWKGCGYATESGG